MMLMIMMMTTTVVKRALARHMATLADHDDGTAQLHWLCYQPFVTLQGVSSTPENIGKSHGNL